jgi:hypothetical protein
LLSEEGELIGSREQKSTPSSIAIRRSKHHRKQIGVLVELSDKECKECKNLKEIQLMKDPQKDQVSFPHIPG